MFWIFFGLICQVLWLTIHCHYLVQGSKSAYLAFNRDVNGYHLRIWTGELAIVCSVGHGKYRGSQGAKGFICTSLAIMQSGRAPGFSGD